MPSARLPPVVLTDDERTMLQQWTRRRRTAQGTALRTRLILAASTGATNTAIAAKLGVVIPTVGKWRRRFLRQRLDGLLDEPRVGAPRAVCDERFAREVRPAAPRGRLGAPRAQDVRDLDRDDGGRAGRRHG
jgi:hypothetical protein